MHYVESPHRLPYEMASGILQAEIGCSYNRCRFCSLCRKPGKDYRPAPREEVEADLDELASYVRRPSRISSTAATPSACRATSLYRCSSTFTRSCPK